MADDEAGDAGAPRDRGAYLSQAYINAFGKYDEPDWDPQQGYVANRFIRRFLPTVPTGALLAERGLIPSHGSLQPANLV